MYLTWNLTRLCLALKATSGMRVFWENPYLPLTIGGRHHDNHRVNFKFLSIIDYIHFYRETLVNTQLLLPLYY